MLENLVKNGCLINETSSYSVFSLKREYKAEKKAQEIVMHHLLVK